MIRTEAVRIVGLPVIVAVAAKLPVVLAVSQTLVEVIHIPGSIAILIGWIIPEALLVALAVGTEVAPAIGLLVIVAAAAILPVMLPVPQSLLEVTDVSASIVLFIIGRSVPEALSVTVSIGLQLARVVWLLVIIAVAAKLPVVLAIPQSLLKSASIIDTDIGDDIDDAFALALALRSPELQIIGITTTFGDTETRAKLVDRFLAEVGRPEIPVAAGAPTPVKGTFTQRRYAEGGHAAKPSHPDAVSFILEQIRRYPGQVTLIAIGPLMNVGAAIDKDPATFRKLKRVLLMGGSIKRGYGDLGYTPPHPPQPEWNILNDIPSAQKLFASGVPLFVMPLDSTQLKLDEVKRTFLFSQGSPLTDALTLLYHQWGQETPTLFDPVTIAFLVNPSLCPVQRMHIRVDEKGFTLPESGLPNAPNIPNAQVCLDSNPDAFFRFLLPRLVYPEPRRAAQ